MKRVVVGIISRENQHGEDEYLLVKSKRDFGRYTGFYYPPGGHVKKSEGEKETLAREIKEELDILVSPIKKIAESPGDVKNQITSWWQCKIRSGELKLNDQELNDVDFFTKEKMEDINIWPATKNFFEKFVFTS